jgi:RimJ/RimL family protein N-acetyltransferase
MYKALNKQVFTNGDFSLVPIRFEDRYEIMKWRNEQIYHLRQNKPLTKEDQDAYFNNVVAKLFDQEKPNQILFSFLENGLCIGYGGLVHINWIDQNAEISFIMQTDLEQKRFAPIWSEYLSLIENVAFDDLGLHKIYTYAFDLRPHLYEAFVIAGYIEEARLKEHCYFESNFLDVVIHSKIK